MSSPVNVQIAATEADKQTKNTTNYHISMQL